MKGAVDDFGNALDAVDFHRPFGLAAKHAGVIHFLKRFPPFGVARHLADKQNHRRGVLLGNMYTGIGIGGTRRTRDHTNAHFAAEFGRCFGHHRRAAFLAAYGDVDVGVVERIQYRQIAFAGHAIHLAHALIAQLLHQNLPTTALRLRAHRLIPCI